MAALRVITASPELMGIYGSTEASPHSATWTQRGALRVAIFTLVAAECTVHQLSSSQCAPRKQMGVNAADFEKTLISAWHHVSAAATDELFEHLDSELLLGSYAHLRKLCGVTLYQARTCKLTHQTLQAAVARSLLVRAIDRIVGALEALAKGTQDSPGDSSMLLMSLGDSVTQCKRDISRARAILELLNAKDSWQVIRATFALCHVTGDPRFAIDDASNTFPLRHMTIGRTKRDLTTAIKEAVARAGASRRIGVAGGQGSTIERQSRAALQNRARPAPTHATRLPPSPKRPRVIASDVRGALRSLMIAMHAVGIELSTPKVLELLSTNSLPNVRLGDRAFEIGIERFQPRLRQPGIAKSAIYDVVVNGNQLQWTYGAFCNTVHVLRQAITK